MSQDNRKRKFIFFIDKERFETEQPSLSVKTLLVDFAKEDPAQTTLVLKQGNELTKFIDLEEVVALKNSMQFLVYHNSPTPVS